MLQPNSEKISYKTSCKRVCTSLQLAFHDLFACLGLDPSGYIGHSSGEILCTYADGCISAEEAILIADSWGRSLEDSNGKVSYSTADVSLSPEEDEWRCLGEISPSGKTEKQSSFGSGSVDLVREMISNLQREGIAAQELPTCNTVRHSAYAQQQMLSKYISDILGTLSRPPSSKWIRSFVHEQDCEELWALQALPQYFAQSLSTATYFSEALERVPENAVIIEIAPRSCLQGNLKQVLPTCTHHTVTCSSMEDNVLNFLKTVGRLFSNNLNVNLTRLYDYRPRSSEPAPASTPFISPLVTWRHEDSWGTSLIDYPKWPVRQTVVQLADPAWSYLKGHKVGSNIMFPAAGYLTVAWMHLAEIFGVPMEKFPVTFQNVSFIRATLLQPSQKIVFKLTVTQQGKFCITEKDVVVVEGSIHGKMEADGQLVSSESSMKKENGKPVLERNEFYREMSLRGYNHAGDFRGVLKLSIDGEEGEILWNNNWTTFLDAFLQTLLLGSDSQHTLIPTEIAHLEIQPHVLHEYLVTSGLRAVRVSSRRDLKTLKCVGIEAAGVALLPILPTVDIAEVFYGPHIFLPYCFTRGEGDGDQRHGFNKLATILSENFYGPMLQIFQITKALKNKFIHSSVNALVQSSPKPVRLTIMTTCESSDELSKYEGDRLRIIKKIDETQLKLDQFAHAVLVLDSPLAAKQAACDIDFGSFLLVPSAFKVHADELEPVADINLDGVRCRLLRKVQRGLLSEIVHVEVDGMDLRWICKLQEEIRERDRNGARRIYATSQNNHFSGVTGLVRCLRAETGGESLRCIFDPFGSLGTMDFQCPSDSLMEIIRKDLAINVLCQSSAVGLFCYSPGIEEMKETDKYSTAEHAHLTIAKPGDLSSLTWVTSPVRTIELKESNDNVLCKVSHAAINFRDVLVATGKVRISASSIQEDPLGYEFAGHDSEGNPIMGIVPSRGIATHVIAEKRFLWRVPGDWSLEDATTPLVAYMSAFYALFIRGRLLQGQSVLIHSGAGGVGQAAIDLALKNNCNVFATVGNAGKSTYLKERFPQLKSHQIASSRDTAFERVVKENTMGRGVDLVLNSLVGELELASLRCVAPYGLLLQISTADSMRKSGLGLDFYQNNIGILGIAPHEVFSRVQDWNLLRDAIDRGLSEGAVRPLPRVVFRADQVEDAFRHMMTGRHTGKLVINFKDHLLNSGENTPSYRLEPAKRVYCCPSRSYVVVGGLGGLGLETAKWLVSRGAQHLVLPSRSGITTGYQALYVHKFKKQGVRVKTPRLDLSSPEVTYKFIEQLESEVPVGGIFNSALVLRDGPLESQTHESFKAVVEPKVFVTLNLDVVSRALCKKLDYFVVFSSIVGARGYDSQSNYGYANAAAERICEARVAAGHHGLAIQWGPLADVGSLWAMLSDTKEGDKDPEEFYGCGFQKPSSCMKSLEKALLQRHSVVTSFVIAKKSTQRTGRPQELWTSLHSIFGHRNLKYLHPNTKLTSLGMDSLVVVELRQLLERDFNHPVTVAQLKSFTIGDLLEIGSSSQSGIATRKRGGPSSAVETSSVYRIHPDALVRLGGPPKHASKIPVFIIHSNDGSSEVFRPLAARLLCPVYAFQYGKYAHLNSLEDLAKAYIEEIKSTFYTGPCRIAGLSGGGTVAFEMATMLEEQQPGMVCELIFLDGSCDYTQNMTDPTKAILKYLEITGLLQQASEEEMGVLLHNLHGDISRSTKVVEELLQKHYFDSTEGASESLVERARMYFKHIIRTMTYIPSREFTGRAHLIRVQESQFVASCTYNLERHCKGTLSCHIVRGHHHDFLSASRVEETASIVNRIIANDDS